MESDTDEFIARAYQVELFEIALKQNTIVYLPTGSGKTFIAVMLIKALSADIRNSYCEGGKRTIFVVNSVPLVLQQSNYITRLTGLSCASLSGDVGVDFWKNTEWNEQLNKHEVLVMTAQILVDALYRGYIKINKVNLIIFDECHRAVNDHPMRQIMQFFELCSKEDQPKILGLSATLLNCNVNLEKIESVIRALEITFHATVVTTKLAIENYYAKEEIIEFDNYVIPNVGVRVTNIIKDLKQTINNVVLKDTIKNIESSPVFRPKNINKKLISILIDIEEQISSIGIYGLNTCILLHLIQLECLKTNMDEMETVYVLQNLITEITKCRKLLENEMQDSIELERIYKYSSDQMHKLFEVLKYNFNNEKNNQKFCCIIFVKRRFTARILYVILKDLSTCSEEYKFLHPDFVIGYSNNPYKNSREALCVSKWNNEALYRFRNGLSNCIIATDILDEGIDIPNCSLVIRYDLVTDVRTYIQSRGRARHEFSKYILLLPRNDMQYLKRYNTYKQIEKYLSKTLVSKTNERIIPGEDEIKNELYQHNIEPYILIDNDGQKCYITEHICIGIINRYCMSLMKSKFIYLSPIWILYELGENTEDKQKQYKVSLKLPVISPLKTVVMGDPMSSVSHAKRSAAMKMCIELHKTGELNNKLMPNMLNSLQENSHLFPNWIDEDQSDTKDNIGTYKKKRHHQLQFPSALYAAFPLCSGVTYLHILDVKPKYSIPHHDNRHLTFYYLLNNIAGFGILSSKQMPEIPSFPIFMNVGELDVNVKVNHSTLHLSKENIMSIKNFHTLIFNEIVPIIKLFMVFDNYNLDNCFLIAPVDASWDINWEVITQYKCIERIPPSVPFHFKITDYELALVTPNYRAADTYIVTQVCDDITPSSCFPTDNFFSYAHYYKERHGLVINNLDQPMLEVKTISKTIDYIIPRHVHGKSRKHRDMDLPKNLKEHLVPELCTRINFPALYWLKATTLPSILHRISQLLIAEDLRRIIAEEAKLGSILNNNKWLPLIITEQEREEVFEFPPEISIENIDNSQSKPVLSGPEIDVLNTEAYQYPWSKDQEPRDLYRNSDKIQLIHIKHYYQFMFEENNQDTNTMRTKANFINKSSVSVPTVQILSTTDSCGPDPLQIMYALTARSGQDAFNLERLETLGDSYLKFVISVFLYNNFPKYHEGPLTTLKGKLIGNRNLYYCGVEKNIPGYMKVDAFAPSSDFIAPAYTVFRQLQKILLDSEVSPNVLYEIEIPQNERFSGHISNITKCTMQDKILHWETTELQTGMEHYLGIQTVSDKTVSDCVEALIGAYLDNMGIKNTVTLLKWFQILPNDIDINTLFHVSDNPIISEGNINYLIPWASYIETKLGYKFKNRGFLLQAFTHPSYTLNNITECYQRLEFLGDALLDFLITCYIYENCRSLSPGALTDLRSALVNNITFACLSVRHGLHTALLSYSPELNNAINRFVKFQEERNHVVNDELLWILLEEEECNIAEYVDVPKVLGDIFESAMGAIYLDSNRDLTVVWEIVYSIMHKEIDQFSKKIPKQPIRVLYETQGTQPLFLNSTVIENTNIVMVPLKVTVAGKVKLFHGFGANKKQAKCAAAKQALKSLLNKI